MSINIFRAEHQRPPRGVRVRRLTTSTAAFALFAGVLGLGAPASAAAPDAGNYTVNFAAAAPLSYGHTVGGGAWNAGAKSSVVSSLEKGDYACTDVLTFLVKIAVKDNAATRALGQHSADVNLDFSAFSTGQQGIGLTTFIGASMSDASDSAVKGSADSAATGTLALNGPKFTKNSYLTGTVSVSNLAAGDTAVLHMNVQVECQTGSYPTGNMDATMQGVTMHAGATSIALNEGVQTIPVKSAAPLLDPSISINKLTNGSDGPTILAGQAVSWTYLVTNTGEVDVTNVQVSDDQGVTVTCPKSTLVPGEAMTCRAAGTAIVGQYNNIGTATAQYAGTGNTHLSASDASSYFGAQPLIDIQKTPDTQEVIDEGSANFTITVTNTGNIELTDVVVDDPLAPSCNNTIGAMAPGAVVTYNCSAPVLANFTNVATVTGNYGAVQVSDLDSAAVTFIDLLPAISVVKTASPITVPETGGWVAFEFTVTNSGPEMMSNLALVDNVFGDLADDCTIPASLAVGASYSCTYNAWLTSLAGPLADHVNTVTATGRDNEGNVASAQDSETVSFTDVMPVISVIKNANPTEVPETGGDVTYYVTVTNTGAEAVVITSLVDDVFGNLVGQGDCNLGAVLNPTQHYDCSFIKHLANLDRTPHTNVVTAKAQDNELNEVSASDDATVTFADVLPTISVSKSANPTAVLETGGDVTYVVTVTNTSLEPVTVTSLVDDKFGNLVGLGDCAIGALLAPAQQYSCTFVRSVAGLDLAPHVNTVIARAVDNELSEAVGTASATVNFIDVLPSVAITKSANPTVVASAGGWVDYTLVVTNTSPEPIQLLNLTDSPTVLDATTSPSCMALIGSLLAPSASATCVIHAWVTGTADTSLTDTATVTAEDNEHNNVSASATATVRFWWYGRSPGYWKNHTEAWTGYATTKLVTETFAIPTALKSGTILDLGGVKGQADTLMDALAYKGGSALTGKAQILLRAAVAALLNEAFYGDYYPPYSTPAALITAVNATLATQNESAYLAMATQLDYWNNANHNVLP